MIWGFLGVSMILKTSYLYLWRHQDTPNNPRRNPNSFLNIIVGTSRHIWKSTILKMLGKTGAEHSWRSVFKILEFLEYGINIFRKKTWNGYFVIWNQHLAKNIKFNLWIFETLKARNQDTLKFFHCQLRESLPPLNIPTLTPAPSVLQPYSRP